MAGRGARRSSHRPGGVGVPGPAGRNSGGSYPAPVTVSATECAPGWSAPRSGNLTVFTVKNTSKNTIYGIDLVGANQVLVYGDIEMLAPGTEDQMDAVLPPGDYLFQCDSFAGATLTSRVERVTGPPVSGRTPTNRSPQTKSRRPRLLTARASPPGWGVSGWPPTH